MITAQKKVEAQTLKRSGIYLTRKRLVILMLIIAAAGLSITLWLITRDSAAESSTKSLVVAYSKRRLIEPRLSGGFHAGEYNPTPDDLTNIDTAKLEDAKRYFFKAVNDSNDIQAWQAHARMLIASRQVNQVNKAMALLRPLAADGGASAEIYNDFGACLFEQGKMEEAIDEFSRALEKRPEMPEAVFNRALCYQQLQLRDEARDDLTRLQGIERDEGWSAESKRRLDEVTRPIQPTERSEEVIAEFKTALDDSNIDQARRVVKENLISVRGYAIENLIKEYSQAVKAQNNADASRALSRLGLIGDLVFEKNGDKEIADLARFIRGLTERDRAQNLALIEDCFKQIDAVEAGEYVKSLAGLERLQGEFAGQGNPVFQVVSASTIARIHYNFNRFTESVNVLEKVLPVIEKRSWFFQHAQALGQLGLGYSRLGQDSRAINSFQKSLEIFRRLRVFEAKALQNFSLPYWHLGDLDKALAYLRDSTKLFLSEASDPSSALAYNSLQMADIYRLRNRHELGMLFAQQSLSFAEQAKHNRYAAQAASFIAVEQAQLKQFESANESLDRASEYLGKIEAARARDYNRPLILTRAGEVAALQGDFDRALEYYGEAETLVAKAQENKIPMIRLLRGRTDVLIAAGRKDEARSNLNRALGKIEEYRSNIIASEQRSYFFDSSQMVFDQAIFLSTDTPEGDAEAFNMSEQSRARSLLEEISDNRPLVEARAPANQPTQGRPEKQSRPLGIAEVQNALPADLAVLEYSVTSQGTHLFLVTRSGFDAWRSDATTERLDSLVNAYLSELRSTAKSSEPAVTEYLSETARALYRELILPVEDKLKGVANLCIIPDKSLHFLPFAALIDREDQYLVASYNLSYAPSASVLARCIKEHDRQRGAKAEKIVAVGNPRFDTIAFPELKDLPDSATEAWEVAYVYGSKHRLVLTDDHATKPRVMAELKDCDVAHLALHCLVKDDSPWKAALVLAPTKSASIPTTQAGQPDGLLSLDELYRVKYPRMKLAVLSACDTALGQYYRGEGIVSLVRPFIASRVPTVLASLWPVESSATRNLMVEFHKERNKMNGRSGEALRTAQLKMASGGFYTHPYYWASFIVIGNSN
jgi:CHAT domain-containing protein/tetratricopeptide (TPR) repeat protein